MRGHWDADHDAFSDVRKFLTDLQDRTSASDRRGANARNDSDVSRERP